MNLIDLLKIKNFDLTKNIKIVRHQDKRCDFYKLVLYNQLETYQKYQGKEVFNCDFIISFIGMESSKAVFYGVYRVNGKPVPSIHFKLPDDFIFQEMVDYNKDVYYNLIKIDGFEDYENRVVIDWGKGTLAWNQKLSPKEVIEVLPKGKIKEFPGFLDFIIDFRELELLTKFDDANRKWKEMLSEVSGIYLIVDGNTGGQYVGSAYGNEGVWGRWMTYAKTGHGNNKLLEEQLIPDKNYRYNYRFSLLQTLPKSMTRNEVFKFESFHKEKLGTRAFGLNS